MFQAYHYDYCKLTIKQSDTMSADDLLYMQS